MVNVHGGKKHKRMKKNSEQEKRVFRRKQEDEEYGLVEKALGSCRFSIKCCDGKVRMGQLRGGQSKSIRIQKDDWVLIGKRTFETNDNKCDILCKYHVDEQQILKNMGVIQSLKIINPENTEDDVIDIDENIAFDFEDI